MGSGVCTSVGFEVNTIRPRGDTMGFSGADLANVVNIAAIKASQVLILADKKPI